jgi:hypothetical protein
MTTKAEVQKLLKPILLKHPGFALHGRRLVATPVHRIVRSFLLDGSSTKTAFRPTWSILPLCVPHPRLHISYGERIGTVEYGYWDITKPNVQEFLIEQFEEKVLPIMRDVQSLEDFKNFLATDSRLDDRCLLPADLIIIESALGNLDTAQKIWIDDISHWTEARHCRDEEDRINLRRRQALGACLMDDDRAGIAALLHEFEAFTVTSNKLEKFWERTPFPMEMQ